MSGWSGMLLTSRSTAVTLGPRSGKKVECRQGPAARSSTLACGVTRPAHCTIHGAGGAPLASGTITPHHLGTPVSGVPNSRNHLAFHDSIPTALLQGP